MFIDYFVSLHSLTHAEPSFKRWSGYREGVLHFEMRR